jgi:hypothetical protein
LPEFMFSSLPNSQHPIPHGQIPMRKTNIWPTKSRSGRLSLQWQWKDL